MKEEKTVSPATRWVNLKGNILMKYQSPKKPKYYVTICVYVIYVYIHIYMKAHKAALRE